MKFADIKKKGLSLLLICVGFTSIQAQINTNRVLAIGKNALYFEDYVLSIQYFNSVIKAKPYLAEPYFYRAIAKLNLDDYGGAENDISACIERNPFLVSSYLLRGVSRQYQGRFDEAIQDYDKGLESRPEDKQMLINKGIALVQKKDFKKAIEALDLLIKYQPRFTQAYLTRGSAYAENGDTVQAMENYNKALDLDKYYAPSYGQRAIIYCYQEKYQEALTDFNEAIRLEPKKIGYYINRGLVRYNLNDLRGAMADYDMVVNLEPMNTVARFNRGLLRSQVGDASHAVEDFDVVIKNEPHNYMAIYNRAILREEMRDYQGAIDDLNLVLEEYPYFVPGYYFRSEIKKEMHDLKGADTDYWYASDMEQKLRKEKEKGKIITGKGIFDSKETADSNPEDADKNTREKSDTGIEKFNRLVVYDKETETKSAYNSEIRGRVQNRQVKVDLQPQFVITYYEKLSEIDQSLMRYNKTLSDYNAKMTLKMQLKVVNHETALTDQQAEYHFKSIDDYSLDLDRDPANVDACFGRALDFMLLQDLSEAINDLGRVINLDPDFVMAYFNRAVIRYKQLELDNYAGNELKEANELSLNVRPSQNKLIQSNTNSYLQPGKKKNTIEVVEKKHAMEYEQIIADYSTVIRLNPDFVYAWFNRANIHCLQKDFQVAILDYNEAINRNPEFSEAYYNRGLTRLYLGETDKGIADLSKAGELGIIDAYSIIKKMTADSD
jgi:tetratricopeptide (TPR) repeat protein